MEGTPDKDPGRSRWSPPPDSDLIGIPLVAGIAVALLAIIAAFALIGPVAGVIVLVAVLVIALAISYRLVSAADIED